MLKIHYLRLVFIMGVVIPVIYIVFFMLVQA